MATSTDRDAARLKALGHPVRLGIAIRLASEPETCACDFAEVFGVSQPTVSEHLRVLREAGLVTTKRRGTQICFARPGVGAGVGTTALGARAATPPSGHGCFDLETLGVSGEPLRAADLGRGRRPLDDARDPSVQDRDLVGEGLERRSL